MRREAWSLTFRARRPLAGPASGRSGGGVPRVESAPRRRRLTIATLIVLAGAVPAGARAQSLAPGQTLLLDTAAGDWQPIPSEGTEMRLSREGEALRIDFDYHGHGGYAIAHRPVSLELPANYEITFRVRGEAPVENLELKLIDPSGDNVWWDNRRDFHFPREWATVRTRKREIGFAWGPAGGGEARRIGAIEVVVTAGSGGKGTVWIDSLRLKALSPEGPYTLTPLATASSSAAGASPTLALDGSVATAWRSAAGGEQWLSVDFLRDRELGALSVDWAGERPPAYDVQLSDDGRAWSTARRIYGGVGLRDHVHLPGAESRYLRLRLQGGSTGYGIARLRFLPWPAGASPDSFFAAVARDEPRGRYPRAYLGQQAYWTIVGVPGAGREALLDTDGRLEPARGSFSIEPFLLAGDTLLTWADGSRVPTLARGDLPIPTATRIADGLRLAVTAFATGADGAGRAAAWAASERAAPSAAPPRATGVSASAAAAPPAAAQTRGTPAAVSPVFPRPAGADGAATDSASPVRLLARYRVENTGAVARRVRLALAVRPFQVNPPWQFLATQGGFAPVDRIALERTGWAVTGGDSTIRISGTMPDTLGATPFEGSGVVRWLAAGRLPPAIQAVDSTGRASGALVYDLALPAGGSADVWLELPPAGSAPVLPHDRAGAARAGEALLAATAGGWVELLDRTRIQLGGSGGPVAAAIRTNLAYILLNRDGPALRPGSRSYARSWIRDGALMAEALLRLGHAAEVRDFIRWYAPYQLASGMVPCCVDARGADPVPENDSHGELIYLVAEYFRFTGDSALVREVWPHVAAAAAYIDTLRQQRMTPEYASGPRRLFYGLLPESISHEGYSAKPMHSYWDDLWGLRGLQDAAFLARALGHDAEAALLAAQAASFRDDIVASMGRSMAGHGIAYIPGAAELGDFDATSTAIALSPLDEGAALPQAALNATFQRYWRDFTARLNGTRDWENYTPYEWRVVGAFARLGWRERADSAIRFFMADRRPAAWNEWAEVVWRDPATPRFIGDMPHTWVSAEFIRSVLDLLVYPRDDALVVGAGVPMEWLDGPGVVLRGLRTRYGALDLEMHRSAGVVSVHLGGALSVPPGGMVVDLPRQGRRVVVNGRELTSDAGPVVVRTLPAEIELRSR